jgi:hypothetical protein
MLRTLDKATLLRKARSSNSADAEVELQLKNALILKYNKYMCVILVNKLSTSWTLLLFYNIFLKKKSLCF